MTQGSVPSGVHDEAAAYFAQELSRLAATGERLSQSHPTLARCLTRRAQNPDIERLIEGTAYLCSQVQARIDACAPEAADSMADMMAPWVHRELPSALIAGIDVPLASAADVQVLPQGTEFRATAGHDGMAFRTTQPTVLLPVRILKQHIAPAPNNRTTVTLTLETSGRLTQQALKEYGLTLFIDGPIEQAQLLAMSLWHATVAAELHDGSSFAALPGAIDAPALHLQPPLTPSFADDPPLQAGLARLRDHFALPHKNLFVTFRLTEAAPETCLAQHICITLTCDSTLGLTSPIEGVTVRLHAVPAVNLRRLDAMPIRTRPAHTRYVLRPQHQAAHAIAVLAIDEAELMGEDGGNARPLPPLHSYRWANRSHLPAGTRGVGMHTLRLPSHSAEPAHLHLHHAGDVPGPLTAETITARLWCHDGAYAAGHAPGALELQANHARGYRAVNLTQSTAVVPALAKKDARYAALSLTAQRSRGVLDKQDVLRALQLLLSVYGSESASYRAQRLAQDSIAEVHTAPATRLWRGAHVLCLDVALTLDPQGFANMAEAYLFAEALAELWADTLPVHGVMRLTLTCPAWGRSITWPLRSGPSTFGALTCTFQDEHR